MVSAQLVINEFSSGTSKDWVELFNTSTNSADLSRFRLEDANGNKKILEGTVPGGGIISFSFSNYLNNSGDAVNLFFTGNSDPIDSIGYGPGTDLCVPAGDQSIGSLPDGSGTIIRFANQTRDGSNTGGTPAPCTTPSSTPSPTKKPTGTPTPTKPEATQTSTPVPVPKATSVTLSSPSDAPETGSGRNVNTQSFIDEEDAGTVEMPYDASRAAQPLVAGVSHERKSPVALIAALLIGSAVTACASVVFAARKLNIETLRQMISRMR